MKKLIAVAIISVPVVLGLWWVKANYFEAGSFLVTSQMNVDYAVRLNVQGEDLRVYGFTPPDAPESTCIIFAGTNKGDMECVNKNGSSSQENLR